jgi:FkbM family methyltransferase
MADHTLPLGVRARHHLAGLIERPLATMWPDRHVLIPGADGRIYLNLHESRMMVQRALRVYEYWTATFMRSLLRPGMSAVDVGANKGDYSLLFARAVGPQGCVLSFEPDPVNAEWLNRTLQANGYAWVQVHECALAAVDGEATFFPGGKSGWGSLRSDRTGSATREPFTVPTRRLDEIVAGARPGGVDLVKVDVEGGELDVIRGCAGIFAGEARTALVMDVDAHDAGERRDLYDLLRSYGLQVWSLSRTLQPATGLEGVGTIVAAKTATWSE